MSYKIQGTGVMRLADGAIIPADERNIDWQEYQRWLAAGGTPQPERTLTEARAQAAARITSARNGALSALTADFSGDAWDADEATSARIANALTMIREAAALGIPTPDAIPWRTADNRDRVLTVVELTQLGAAVFLAQQQVWVKQAALKNQIAQAATGPLIDEVRW